MTLNSLTLNNNAAGTITTVTDNAATGTITNNGTITTLSDNHGIVENNATITTVTLNSLTLNNNAAGTITTVTDNASGATITNDGTITTLSDNHGTVTNNATGTITTVTLNSATLTNAGTITTVTDNASGATITNNGTITTLSDNHGTVTNNAAGTINTVSDNHATLTNSGTVGSLTSSAGAVTNTGTMASVTIQGGTFTSSGTITGALSNAGTAFLSNTIGGNVTNSGTTTLLGNLSTGSSFNNSGIFYVDGTKTLTVGAGTGTLTNSGTISMTNPSVTATATDVATINGNLASSGGTINLNVNYGNLTADKLTVTGNFTGTFNLGLTDIGTAEAKTPGLTQLISVGGSNGAALSSVSGLDNGVFVRHQITEDSNGWYLKTSLNLAPVGGVIGSISAAQSLVNMLVSRPQNAFIRPAISDKKNDCSPGGYVRGFKGTSDTSSQTASAGSDTANVKLSSDYYGSQIGMDLGCANVQGNDVAINAGFFGMVNIGKTSQNQVINNIGTINSNNSFNSRGLGVYASYDRSGFKLYGQMAYDWTKFDINSQVASQTFVQAHDLASERFSAGINASYQFNVTNEVAVTPNIGFSYARAKTNDLAIWSNGAPGADRLHFDPMVSELGFAGVTLSRTALTDDETGAFTLYGTVAGYKDFAPDAITYYVPSGSPQVKTSTTNSGAYAEFSVGANFDKLLDKGPAGMRQLAAGLRADFTTGDNIHGARFTGQLRLQF